MALDAFGGILARDWNGIIWKERCYNPATVMTSVYHAKSKQSHKDNSINLSAKYNAIISMLRLDNLLGAHAVAMGGFRFPMTTTIAPPPMTVGGFEMPSSAS